MELYILLFVLVDIILSLLLQSLRMTLPILFAAMAFAFAVMIKDSDKNLGTARVSGANLQCNLKFSVSLILLLTFYIIFTPKGYDARYIYYFHGKIIYFAGGIFQSINWNDPAAGIPHPDYPKLIAIVSAQIAYIFGYWNEYLPKLSLLALAVPSSITLGRLALDRNVGLLVFLSFPILLGGWLWNGYMDAYLALFAGLSFICFWFYILLDIELFIYLAIIYLGLCGSLKNEGLLIIPSVAAGIAIVFLRTRLRLHIPQYSKLRIFIYTALSIAPIVIWRLYTYHWSLSNDLELGTMRSFSRILERMSDYTTASKVIFRMLLRSKLYFMIPLSILAVIYSKKKELMNRFLKNIIISGYCISFIYMLGIFAVLMSSPQSSIKHAYECNRILKPVEVWLVSICYFVMIAKFYPHLFSPTCTGLRSSSNHSNTQSNDSQGTCC
jgi:hypothetical protein